MSVQQWFIGAIILAMVAFGAWVNRFSGPPAAPDYLRATYSPLHFRPAIAKATDAQCLACHGEILADKLRSAGSAAARPDAPLVGHQRLSTYQGGQESFHRRHLVTPFARQVMDLRCTTCHRGHDPREEAPGSSATAAGQDEAAFALRKQVDPATTCLKCHGQMPWRHMNLPGPWPEVRQAFGNSCHANCHETIRTRRHQVSYLKAAAIETAGRANADVCYGCHGGRAWYRLSYPYPRHAWPGMPQAVPAWAKNRPVDSEPEFLAAAAPRRFKP